MLDIKLLRDDSQKIAQNLADRHARVFADLGPADGPDWASRTTDRLVTLDRRYLDLLQRQDELRRAQNETSAGMKAVSKLPKEEQAAARERLVVEGRRLRDEERQLTQDTEALELVDFASGAKVTGPKFYYLKNDAVLLDLALQHFALGVARKHGFTLHTTPDLAREEILRGLGFNPRGESTQIYSIADTDLCLVGTAEITLGGMLADTILEEEQLPLLLAGVSHCFRTEAGSAGQESRGLYRVHQFTKVELFAFVSAEDDASELMHARLLAIEEEIFQALGIPYRVLDIASGDLGGPAYRKFDLEAWMPGRGAYGEITSTSNCTDYQARRLKIRYRPAAPDGSKQKPRHVHMLNGTAVACSRALVAILENYQQADGTVVVPEVLRPIVGKDRITSARGHGS